MAPSVVTQWRAVSTQYRLTRVPEQPPLTVTLAFLGPGAAGTHHRTHAQDKRDPAQRSVLRTMRSSS